MTHRPRSPTITRLDVAGGRLRAAGLTPRALAAWAGTDRISALPGRLPLLVARDITPASAPLALLVAGATVPRDLLRGLVLDELVANDLVGFDGPFVHARVGILPLGPSLLVCDRLDALDEAELVCWPDDSSHHLASALPAGRRDTWLDLGCGSAFAPLARPELASAITGLDLNPRAVRYAQLGTALSGIAHFEVDQGDLGEATATAELVTCNAPIPDVVDRPVWRRAGEGFFDRLWSIARTHVAPGGMVVVHATEAALLALADLPGERVVVRYTPEDDPGFGIAWWRPDAADRYVRAHRLLELARPHLDAADRDAAIAGSLS